MSDDAAQKPEPFKPDWPPLRPVSPAIERLFRFVEMVGIVALLRLVVLPADVEAAMIITVGGSMLAAYYLIEPIMDAVFDPYYRRAKTPLRFLIRIGATILATFVILWPVSIVVSILALLIAQTIGG